MHFSADFIVICSKDQNIVVPIVLVLTLKPLGFITSYLTCKLTKQDVSSDAKENDFVIIIMGSWMPTAF